MSSRQHLIATAMIGKTTLATQIQMETRPLPSGLFTMRLGDLCESWRVIFNTSMEENYAPGLVLVIVRAVDLAHVRLGNTPLRVTAGEVILCEVVPGAPLGNIPRNAPSVAHLVRREDTAIQTSKGAPIVLLASTVA